MQRAIVLITLALFALPALSAGQQDKMKTCNAEASKQELKGNTRKAFMKQCLSADAETKPESSATAQPEAKSEATEEKVLTPQQQKMKSCNAQAKAKLLRGNERKTFMGECLKS